MGKKGKTQFRSQPPPCAYCGAPSSTRDDVIPRCVFDVLDLHMIKVRACFECNQRKKRYDEMLRDMLATDVRTQDHPVARAKFWGEFTRAAMRGQSELARRVARESWEQDYVTRAGIFLGRVAAVDVGAELDTELRYIVRGLTAWYKRGFVHPDAQIRVGLLDDLGASNVWETMQQKGGITLDRRSGDVCIWANQYSDANRSVWLIAFYGRMFFLVTVLPPDADFDAIVAREESQTAA